MAGSAPRGMGAMGAIYTRGRVVTGMTVFAIFAKHTLTAIRAIFRMKTIWIPAFFECGNQSLKLRFKLATFHRLRPPFQWSDISV